jgi:glycosyltransferase involved in cell wall biosynthesis
MSLRIGIDARFLNHRGLGGYQTYLQELVGAFGRRRLEHELFLILAYPSPSGGGSGWGLTSVVSRVTIPFAGVAWREQVAIPRLARRLRFDLMHFPCNTMPRDASLPAVATIHDTIGLTNRQPTRGLRQGLIRRYERFGVRNSLRRARLVITPSAIVADELAGVGMPASRLRTVHSGIRHSMRPASGDRLRSFRLRHDLTRPYLLTLASADPRKNVETAIAALSALDGKAADLSLVIVMTNPLLKSRFQSLAAELGVLGRLRFLEALPDDELALCYAGARATLFLSRDEGFGMPPLESMACGTPVICSDLPPMNQLYGDAVLLVDPGRPESVVAALRRLLAEQDLRRGLTTRGFSRAADFSWDRAAEQTIAVYEEAAAC